MVYVAIVAQRKKVSLHSKCNDTIKFNDIAGKSVYCNLSY